MRGGPYGRRACACARTGACVRGFRVRAAGPLCPGRRRYARRRPAGRATPARRLGCPCPKSCSGLYPLVLAVPTSGRVTRSASVPSRRDGPAIRRYWRRRSPDCCKTGTGLHRSSGGIQCCGEMREFPFLAVAAVHGETDLPAGRTMRPVCRTEVRRRVPISRKHHGASRFGGVPRARGSIWSGSPHGVGAIALEHWRCPSQADSPPNRANERGLGVFAVMLELCPAPDVPRFPQNF